MQSSYSKTRIALGAIKPWSIAAFTANRNEVVQAAGSATGLAGVTDRYGIDASSADRTVDIGLTEVNEVQLGGAVAAGDPITSDANGLGIKAAKVAGAEVFCLGIAQEPGVQGDVVMCLISPFVITG